MTWKLKVATLVATTSIFAAGVPAQDHQANAAQQPQTMKAYGQLPLSFTANQGQFDSTVAFQTRGSGYSIDLTRHAVALSLKQSAPEHFSGTPVAYQDLRENDQGKSVNVAMYFPGAAEDPSIYGMDELPGKANYLIGNDPSKWHTGVATYAKVKYAGLYPGIDLVYYGTQKQLEFDFILQPGANPEAVKLAFRNDRAGKEVKLTINQAGDLLIGEEGEEVVLPRPVVYQLAADADTTSEKHVVEASYVLLPGHQVRFQIGAYDKSRALVIDPTVAYSTLLGGTHGAITTSIAVNAAGEAFVTGSAGSDFPTTPGVFNRQETNASAVFVSKLNAGGTALVYSTFISGQGGGNRDIDHGNAIAIDSAGNAYVAGVTNATGFPITRGPHPIGFEITTFVSKLNPTGTGLVYSILLVGGSNVNAIAVDRSGSAYVAGSASSKFQTTAGAYQPSAGDSDQSGHAFVAKLNKAGSGFVYSTLLGTGTTNMALAVDAAGDAYVTGYNFTTSPFPTTPGALSATGTVYVTKFNPSGTALLYSTFLQGNVFPRAMAIDTSGSAYVTGVVYTTITTTPGAFQTSSLGRGQGFVMKLNAAGSAYDYSTYLGGSTGGTLYGIKADAKGNAYVVGETDARDYPVTSGAFQPTLAGRFLNATFSVLNRAGSALLYSTFLGGSGGASAQSVALDPSDSAYVAGYTLPDYGDTRIPFPVTSGAFQTTLPTDTSGGFVTKFLFPPSGSLGQTILFASLGDRVYGNGPVNLAATATSGLPVTYAVAGPVTLSGTKLTILGAGQVTVIASQAGNSVYDAAPDVTRTFIVHKGRIQVTADNAIRLVGTANPAFSYSLTGFVHGDKSSVISGAATESTTAVVSSGSGIYPITFATESLTADNYAFVYVPGTLTVTDQQCQAINSYANGFTAAGLSLNRGAKIQGSALQLTDGQSSEGRTAFYTSPVLITAFTTDFSFQLLNAFADGFTFTVQSNSPKAYGIGGQGLGYKGIPNSAAIKFDLHNNQGEGSDSMGFYQEGVAPTVPDVDLSHTGIDLHSGHVFQAHIAYANAQVAVTVRDTQTGATVNQTFPGDLSATVGTGAYVGFTGGTGARTATQNILNWSFAGGPGCGTGIPSR